MKGWPVLLLVGSSLVTLTEQECGGGGNSIPATSQDYVIFAWNDLGMHCLNPTYDEAVILPPYNTVWAQVVKRANPPEVVTSGVTLEYRLLNNTYSAGKTDSFGADFGQFWDYSDELFGVTLEVDTGLNLKDPDLHNGLSGTMVLEGDHFEVDGMPVVPVDDDGVWNPYQVAEITAKDASGRVIATTQATVPTSDDINCALCHAQGKVATEAIGGGVASPFMNILLLHDQENGTDLSNQTPVLCASCHGSPALGATGPGAAGLYLSQAVHGKHAETGAECYDCHPGQATKCNRSKAHTSSNGNCTSCHGSMAEVASSIDQGRVPWVDEPKCSTCHTGVSGVDTGDTLYRNATGHGNLYCTTCHNSPHVMYPSTEQVDNYQPIQYQGEALTIGSCAVCHDTSKGGGSAEFSQQHGATNSQPSACNVCHTAVTGTTTQWPHSFTWKAR